MNAKDAYQNTLWNKLPYTIKQSIFVSTENGEFSVVIKVTGNDKTDVTNWISYLKSLEYEVNTNMFMPGEDEKYLIIDWDHNGKRKKI